MLSHFNDVTRTDLWLAPIPRLSGPVGGYIDSVYACTLRVQSSRVKLCWVIHSRV